MPTLGESELSAFQTPGIASSRDSQSWRAAKENCNIKNHRPHWDSPAPEECTRRSHEACPDPNAFWGYRTPKAILRAPETAMRTSSSAMTLTSSATLTKDSPCTSTSVRPTRTKAPGSGPTWTLFSGSTPGSTPAISPPARATMPCTTLSTWRAWDRPGHRHPQAAEG